MPTESTNMLFWYPGYLCPSPTHGDAAIIVVSYQDLFAIKALSWDAEFTEKCPEITVIFFPENF